MSRHSVLERAPRRPAIGGPPAVPFLKWAGGKRSLLSDIAKYFPEKVGTYWEPFVGGGAVFFAMADRMDRAILSDANEELICAYHVVQTQVDDLIEALREHRKKHLRDDDYYYKVRSGEFRYRRPDTELEAAARTLYLNRTCFNGLYRVNSRGEFNTPKGSYENPDICNEDRLRAASRALKKARLEVGDFGEVVKPGASDFIYCDPPYDGCFNGYRPGGFSEDDQRRLKTAADAWAAGGADVMLSNADTRRIRKIYRGGGGSVMCCIRRGLPAR